MLTRLNIARALIVLGFVVGLGSLGATLDHITNPAYSLDTAFDGGPGHARYHAFRELVGNIAAMVVILTVFFAPARHRTPLTWSLCLILMLGYYLPFWAGMPFMTALSAPGLSAEINHVTQAALALAGLLIGHRAFFQDPSEASDSP